jgi:hypothetical protein
VIAIRGTMSLDDCIVDALVSHFLYTIFIYIYMKLTECLVCISFALRHCTNEHTVKLLVDVCFGLLLLFRLSIHVPTLPVSCQMVLLLLSLHCRLSRTI